MSQSLTYLSLTGMLGYGYPLGSLEKGLEAEPAFIGVDAGSTDPGPYYLGSGRAFVGRSQVVRDLAPALEAALSRGIPLIIGSAGGAGAAPHVKWFMGILKEVARDGGHSFDAAVIHADVEAGALHAALEAGRISSCGPAPELTHEAVDSCSHIVAQMGTAPLIEGLRTDADVIVAGRCCDTAIFAALPMMKGFDPALAFHAAKIAECGTLCARPGGANDALVCTIEPDNFAVRPAGDEKACYPDTVAAHTLYEQPEPDCFIEPEGVIDVSACTFEQSGDRAVTVRGTQLESDQHHTVKVEGAALRGYRTIAVAGARDPGVIANMNGIEVAVRRTVAESFGEGPSYSLRFIRYGENGVLGDIEQERFGGHEVGIVIEAIADDQETADAICGLARSTALHQHFKGRKTTAGNLAFPFSPSDFAGGPVYEFAVYHLLEVADERAMFPVECVEVRP